jgi:hypothetical protein
MNPSCPACRSMNSPGVPQCWRCGEQLGEQRDVHAGPGSPRQASPRRGPVFTVTLIALGGVAGLAAWLFLTGPGGTGAIDNSAPPVSDPGDGTAGDSSLTFPSRLGGQPLNAGSLDEVREVYAELGAQVEAASWGKVLDGARYLAMVTRDIPNPSREVVIGFAVRVQTNERTPALEERADGVLFRCFDVGFGVEQLRGTDMTWCAWETEADVGILLDTSSARYPLKLTKTLRTQLGL